MRVLLEIACREPRAFSFPLEEREEVDESVEYVEGLEGGGLGMPGGRPGTQKIAGSAMKTKLRFLTDSSTVCVGV